MNGTCNFILTKMMNEKQNLADVLKEAQALGYAEADPTPLMSVDLMVLLQLFILASIAYGINVKPEEILLKALRISIVKIFTCERVWLTTLNFLPLQKKGDEVELRVHPALSLREANDCKSGRCVMNGIRRYRRSCR